MSKQLDRALLEAPVSFALSEVNAPRRGEPAIRQALEPHTVLPGCTEIGRSESSAAGTIAGGQQVCPTAHAAPSYPYLRARRTDVTSGPKNFAGARPAPGRGAAQFIVSDGFTAAAAG
jgi:hypothetical protein